jgi:hypothetical protein
MIVGMLAVWLCGHLVVTRVASVRGVLLLGGVCTALSQVFPLLQIVAGATALEAVPLHESGPEVEAAAFVVTIFTAGQILVVALICGSMIRGLDRVIGRRISRRQY